MLQALGERVGVHADKHLSARLGLKPGILSQAIHPIPSSNTLYSLQHLELLD